MGHSIILRTIRPLSPVGWCNSVPGEVYKQLGYAGNSRAGQLDDSLVANGVVTVG